MVNYGGRKNAPLFPNKESWMTRQKVVLVVLKDVSPTRMAVPVVKRLREAGITVRIVAEGAAVEEWQKLMSERPCMTPHPDCGVDFLGRALFNRFLPSAVVVGLSCGINLERQIAQIATSRNPSVPVVFLEDMAGACERLQGVVPSLVVCSSVHAKQMARRRYGHGTPVSYANAGLISFPNKPTIVSPKVRAIVESIHRAGKVLVLWAESVGVGKFSEQAALEQIDLVARCVAKGNRLSPWCMVVSSVHTRWQKGGMGKEWPDMLSANVHESVAIEGATGDELATVADFTLSSGPGSLMRSLYAGKKAFALATPSTKAQWKESHGYESLPLIDEGIVQTIENPVSLLSLADPDWGKFKKLKPYNPDVATRAILRMLEKSVWG
jgi:hypothetical protein